MQICILNDSVDPGESASDLDLCCLERRGAAGFRRTRVKSEPTLSNLYTMELKLSIRLHFREECFRFQMHSSTLTLLCR